MLCDTSVGYQVAKVIDIVEQLDYDGAKVDFSDFQKRIEERKCKVELKAKMDAMVKDDKELMLYQMLAERNPVMRGMLDEYTNINV